MPQRTIRPETPADYAAIAELHAEAFNYRMDEANIVADLRQRQSYTPALSLVAQEGKFIVGHALFTPVTIRLMGQGVSAVLLAPIGVLPDAQGFGIGGDLIQAGHDFARQQGFDIAMLLGHDTYYPRFGYRTGAFGNSKLEITTANYPPDTTLQTQFSIFPPYYKKLVALWQHEEQAVDFSLQPEAHPADWMTSNSRIQVRLYMREAEGLVGYTRIAGDTVTMFLAKDHAAARAMIPHIAGDAETITLPLHPNSASTSAFNERAVAAAWDAGMAMGLTPQGETLLNDYFNGIKSGDIIAGRPLWFPAFE